MIFGNILFKFLFNKKNKNINSGFSFIEVIIAICVIGVLLVTLLGLMTDIFDKVGYQNNLLNNFIKQKNIFEDGNYYDLDSFNKFNNKNLKINIINPKSSSRLHSFENIKIVNISNSSNSNASLTKLIYFKKNKEKDSAKK